MFLLLSAGFYLTSWSEEELRCEKFSARLTLGKIRTFDFDFHPWKLKLCSRSRAFPCGESFLKSNWWLKWALARIRLRRKLKTHGIYETWCTAEVNWATLELEVNELVAELHRGAAFMTSQSTLSSKKTSSKLSPTPPHTQPQDRISATAASITFSPDFSRLQAVNTWTIAKIPTLIRIDKQNSVYMWMF